MSVPTTHNKILFGPSSVNGLLGSYEMKITAFLDSCNDKTWNNSVHSYHMIKQGLIDEIVKQKSILFQSILLGHSVKQR